MRTIVNCHTCDDGQWVVKEPACKECIGYSKWALRKKKPVEPKPIYVGHREVYRTCFICGDEISAETINRHKDTEICQECIDLED